MSKSSEDGSKKKIGGAYPKGTSCGAHPKGTSCGAPLRPDSAQGQPILARAPDSPAGGGAGEKPAHQRPELPAFWDHRFTKGSTPWDAGRVPARLASFAGAHSGQPRTLIPGCGSAYEAAFLDRLGWPVTALDFSAAAIAAARAQLTGFGGELLHADFFAFPVTAPFALIYERAFLCALPRKLWTSYAERCAALLVPGGLLAGFFYFGDEAKGPPFAIEPQALDALLGPWFERIDDAPAEDSIAVFAGKERWQVWRRRMADA